MHTHTPSRDWIVARYIQRNSRQDILPSEWNVKEKMARKMENVCVRDKKVLATVTLDMRGATNGVTLKLFSYEAKRQSISRTQW